MDVANTFKDVRNMNIQQGFGAAKDAQGKGVKKNFGDANDATKSDGTLLQDNYKTYNTKGKEIYAGREDQVKEKDYPLDGKNEKADTLYSTKNSEENDISISNKHGYKNHKLVIERDGKDNVTLEGSGWKQEKYGYKEGASGKEGTTYKDNHGNEVLIIGEGKTVDIVA